ncbi:MAG: hypothetical protein Tsb0034_11530 [Ekhidna sp.]
MKKLRFVLIGIVLGGAMGAKTGGYLATLLDAQVSAWIQAGFIYGSMAGVLTLVAFKVGSVVSSMDRRPNHSVNAWSLSDSHQS